MEKETRCAEKVRERCKSRLEDITTLWNLNKKDPDASDPDLGTWNEYGLCFDYVAPGTFNDQKRGYFRYQISFGGPSEEIRFYSDEGLNLVRAEFWYLDWFDGAKTKIAGKNLAVISEIWEDFKGMDLLKQKMEDAQ